MEKKKKAYSGKGERLKWREGVSAQSRETTKKKKDESLATAHMRDKQKKKKKREFLRFSVARSDNERTRY